DVEPAGQCRDELAILGRHGLGEAVFDRALKGRGSRDEMADITHGRYLLMNGCSFLRPGSCHPSESAAMRARAFWYANVQGRHVTNAGFAFRGCASGKAFAEMHYFHPGMVAVLPSPDPLKEARLGQPNRQRTYSPQGH